MVFVGNDIVHLNDPKNLRVEISNRYLNKSFTPAEQETILKHKKPSLELWRHWACKEAAYKILMKMGATTSFVPKSIEVQPYESRAELSMTANYQGINLYFVSEATQDYVFTYGSNLKDAVPLIHSKVGKGFESEESALVRATLFQLISENCPEYSTLEVVKNSNNIPLLFNNGARLPVDISLTHDYGFVAATYMMNSNLSATLNS